MPKKAAAKSVKDVSALLKAAPKRAFPAELSPMLATLVDKPFSSVDWSFEVKWDGYRALAL